MRSQNGGHRKQVSAAKKTLGDAGSCAFAASLARCSPAARRLDDGSHWMQSRMQTAPAPVAAPKRGIFVELYHDHRIYYAVTSRGERLPGVRVPIGLETEGDVIADLWLALQRDDPKPPVLRLVGGLRGLPR